MSQHTKKIHDVFDTRITVRLSDSQYSFLSSYSSSLNLSPSECIRKMIDYYKEVLYEHKQTYFDN